MITYACANCRKELEIDDNLAGSRVRCPHCGNVEHAPNPRPQPVARTRPQPETSDDRAAAAGLPADTGPEQHVLTVHPAMARARPAQAAGILLGIVAGITLAVFAWTSASMGLYRWTGYAGLGVAVAGVGGLVWWKLQALGTTVTITNKRTRLRQGFFSKATKELLHNQVQDVQVTQTFAQRVLRVGTLGLDGGGTDQVEIVIPNLPNPEKLRSIIDTYRDLG